MRKPSRCHGVRLSGADRKRLAAALETAGEARVYRRVEALLLVAEGQSVAEAARRCRVDRSSVHRWLAKYGVGRDAAELVDRPRSGRPRQSSRLTPRRLAAVLARDPRRCGYQATSWTVPLLTHYLASQEGIAISTLKDPLIFLLQNQLVSHTQSEVERSPSLPRLSLHGESRAAGRV